MTIHEDLGSQFHVSERRGLLQAVCLRCGKFVGASASDAILRTALRAHHCHHAEPSSVTEVQSPKRLAKPK